MIKVRLEEGKAIFQDRGCVAIVDMRCPTGEATVTSLKSANMGATGTMILRGVLLEAARFAEIVNGTYQPENYNE